MVEFLSSLPIISNLWMFYEALHGKSCFGESNRVLHMFRAAICSEKKGWNQHRFPFADGFKLRISTFVICNDMILCMAQMVNIVLNDWIQLEKSDLKKYSSFSVMSWPVTTRSLGHEGNDWHFWVNVFHIPRSENPRSFGWGFPARNIPIGIR